MIKIYNSGSGSVYQEIFVNESIQKYSDLSSLIIPPKPHKNLFYGGNKIEYECEIRLVGTDNELLDGADEIGFDENIYVCFKINYKLELISSFDSNIPFPSFVTEINLGNNNQELPTEWPKSVHTIGLGNNTQELPTEWPKSVHTIDLGNNTQERPTEWPKSVHTIHLCDNKAKLPSEWPESLHTIYLWQNKSELPDEWPESVHTIHLWDNEQELPSKWPESVRVISIFNDSPYLKNLLSDIRLEKVNKDKYNTYFKLNPQ